MGSLEECILDRTSPVPMYHQVKNEIVEMIRSGSFQVGDKVFSESEICARYEVSPITAKRVLNDLAKDGYISRQPGRGSFVTHRQPISHVLNNFYSFTEEVLARGMVPSHRLIRLEMVEAPEACATFFSLPPGEPVLLVQRQRFASGQLIALDNSFMHGPVCKQLTTQALEASSLYSLLTQYGQKPDKAVEFFDAASLGDEEARLLELPPASAVLKVSRHTFSEGKPVEYNYRYYTPNQYIYRIELSLNR